MQSIRHDLKDRHDIDFVVKKGGVELFTEFLIGLNPASVHNLWNASKRVVETLLASNESTLSGTSIRNIILMPGSWEKLTARPSRTAEKSDRVVPPA